MVSPPISCLYACLLLNPDLAKISQLLVIQTCLQEFIGPSPTVLLEPFSNWQDLVTYDHVFVTKPRTAEEIQRTVSAASTCGLQVRAVGSAHTADQVFGGRGRVHINMSELALGGGKRVIMQPEIAGKRVASVKVTAGVTQAELNNELAKYGFVFHPGPLIGEATIGGAVATSAHNGFYHEPSIGGYMTRVKLVDGRGNIREFNQNSDANMMKALRCHLGLLGILFEIELEVIQQVAVNFQQVFTPLRNLFSPTFLRDLILENEFVDMFYAPYNSLTEKETKEVTLTGRVPKSWDSGNDLVLIRIINQTSAKRNFEDERPPSVPQITYNKAAFEAQLSYPVSVVKNLTDVLFLNILGIPAVDSMEYVMVDPNFTNGAAAMQVRYTVFQ
ncbi:D-arabinono-1,4-lactone oxidase-like [Lingula anatina]|uniref:D-arabinono-1,4-lactone oxidase-like n=1 Tax=Lingula anatina TaxID=7574 RepID=A0A1S3J5J7_LINAN|nr:D-arabinono-1,4-lactone oxidase-like [Lingula anatina]|eukprot:XP_013405665.1 D-arabinono-1,4-lactone oxidase-like [Lingula anatina]